MWNRIRKRLRGMSENNRTVLRHVTGAFVVKGFSVLVSLCTMPAYLDYFGDEVALGLWFTVLSVLNWILNFDLGIGNGLRNHLTRTITKGEAEESKKYLSSAYISIGVLCLAVSAVFMAVSPFVDWNVVFNIDPSIVSRRALFKTVCIVFIGIVMHLFLKLIYSILYAMQKSSVNNLLNLISTLTTLLCVLLLPTGTNDQNMVRMAVVHEAAALLPLLITTVIVFCGRTLRSSVPAPQHFRFSYAKEVLSLGGMFLFSQVSYMVIMSTNEYLITALCGNASVTEYNIYHKLFSFGATVFSLAMPPLWSAVTKAFVQKNYQWIERLYRLLLLLSFGGAVMEFLLIPFLRLFVNLWLQDQAIEVNPLYGIPFALLGGLMILNSALTSIASGLGEVKTQAVFFALGALLKIPLAYLLVRFTGDWIGVVWANVIAMGLYGIVQPIVLKKQISKYKKEV